jgi:hypothetical protein
MEFGVFDHLDRHGGALADYYEDRLKIAEAYDRAGFYAYHLAEHHATPLGMAPSPSVFLAAVAQRTTRLRFGPLVWPMPLHHPLRLIEEICMLDQLSGESKLRGRSAQSMSHPWCERSSPRETHKPIGPDHGNATGLHDPHHSLGSG